MNLSGILQNALTATAQTSQDQTSQKDKLHKAAQQFESLLVSEMLKSAHGSDGDGWLGENEAAGSDTAGQMAESQLSEALSSGKGLGLASVIERAMSSRVS